MLGPLLFVYKGVTVKFFVLQKKNFCNSKKKFQKSLFHKKIFLLNMNLKNVVKQKDAQGSYYWAQKKFQPEKKIKLKVWHSYKKKNLKSHFRDPKKRFFQFRILRSVFICSLYLLQTLV